MKMKLAKAIRVATIAPVMALISLTVLYSARPEAFNSLTDYITAVIFLALLPVLAYPLQPIIPRFKDKGREGQRNLAIWMAAAGYIFGIIYAFAARTAPMLKMMFCTYFISGIFIIIFNRIFKIKASGHACGVAGPIAYLAICVGTEALWGVCLLALVFWSSMKMKRHTLDQLLWGSAISVLATVFAGIGTSVIVF